MFMSETISPDHVMTSTTHDVMNCPQSLAFRGFPHFQNMRKGL